MGIFHWIYCLDLPKAALLAALLTVFFLVMKKFFGAHLWWKILLGAALMLSLGAVLYTTAFRRVQSGECGVYLQPFASYRLMLENGNREILRSNFMNALLFYPAGLLGVSLLSGKWPAWKRIVLTVALLCLLSIGIETVQYLYRMGQVETDDVLHNTLGAALGSLWGSIPFRKTK